MSAPTDTQGTSRVATGPTTAKASPAGAAARRSGAWCRGSARPSTARAARSRSAFRLLLEALRDQRVDELRDVAAERRDLPHQRRGDEHVLLGGREEDRLHLGIEAAVHAGELELVFEVGHGAQ